MLNVNKVRAVECVTEDYFNNHIVADEDSMIDSDTWTCDPDYIFTPASTVEPFVTVRRDGTTYIVTPCDLDYAAAEDVLRAFVIGNMLPTELDELCPKLQSSWVDAVREYAILNDKFVVAFRGGCGYTYALHVVEVE